MLNNRYDPLDRMQGFVAWAAFLLLFVWLSIDGFYTWRMRSEVQAIKRKIAVEPAQVLEELQNRLSVRPEEVLDEVRALRYAVESLAANLTTTVDGQAEQPPR